MYFALYVHLAAHQAIQYCQISPANFCLNNYAIEVRFDQDIYGLQLWLTCHDIARTQLRLKIFGHFDVRDREKNIISPFAAMDIIKDN
jgi:hypothetical protein